MQWQVPIEVRKGARPSIPDKIPPKMMEIWNIAQECWSGSPQDRPSSKAVLEKLEKLARLVTQYQWQDLLNPALHPTYFDTVLMSLLQSKAEVEKIQELDEQMFRNVVDVLDQVRVFLVCVHSCLFTNALSAEIGNQGPDEWAPEEILQISKPSLRRPWNFTNAMCIETW